VCGRQAASVWRLSTTHTHTHKRERQRDTPKNKTQTGPTVAASID
jgi:hypothetical protein